MAEYNIERFGTGSIDFSMERKNAEFSIRIAEVSKVERSGSATYHLYNPDVNGRGPKSDAFEAHLIDKSGNNYIVRNGSLRIKIPKDIGQKLVNKIKSEGMVE